MTKPYGPNESGFRIQVRDDGRYTLTLTAIRQENAITVTKDYHGGIMPGAVARMLKLEGPLDIAGEF